MKSIVHCLMIGVAVLLGGCVRRNAVPVDEPPPRLVVEESARVDVPGLVKGNTQFAIELLERLGSRGENVVIAPVSVATALGMTRAGARGETAQQVEHVLHVPYEGPRLHRAFAALIQGLQEDSLPLKDLGPAAARFSPRLLMANACWARQGGAVLGEFRETLARHYGAEVNLVDFGSDPAGAARAMNAWVERNTLGKIAGPFGPGTLDPHAQLVLVIAVYFKGSWSLTFEKAQTRDEAFFTAPGQSVQAPMMHASGMPCRAWNGGTFLALELPCKGEKFAMVVLLPNRVDGLPELEASLSAERLADWLSRLAPSEVDVALPRFRIEAHLNLSGVLAEMGMPLAFGPTADFSGVNGRSAGIPLSALVQATFVDVNEEGIEAAAAVYSVVSADSDPVTSFRADHPFLFLLRDARTGSLRSWGG